MITDTLCVTSGVHPSASDSDWTVATLQPARASRILCRYTYRPTICKLKPRGQVMSYHKPPIPPHELVPGKLVPSIPSKSIPERLPAPGAPRARSSLILIRPSAIPPTGRQSEVCALQSPLCKHLPHARSHSFSGVQPSTSIVPSRGLWRCAHNPNPGHIADPGPRGRHGLACSPGLPVPVSASAHHHSLAPWLVHSGQVGSPRSRVQCTCATTVSSDMTGMTWMTGMTSIQHPSGDRGKHDTLLADP